QVRVPAALPGSTLKVAPGGKPERSAVRERIASPPTSSAWITAPARNGSASWAAGSATPTVSESVRDSDTDTVTGTAMAGGRSTSATVITVLADAESAFAAVKVTVYDPASGQV